MPTTDTEARLRAWAAALAGQQVQRTARTGTERIDQAIEVVNIVADVMRIESIVQRMEAAGRWKEGRVLRTEYFMAGLPESGRLAAIARMGTPISRTSYYAYLTSARAYVEGALAMAVAA